MRVLITLHNFLPEPMLGAENACAAQMRELLRTGNVVGLFYAGNRAPDPGQLARHGLDGVVLYRVGYRPTKAQVLLSIRKPHVEQAFSRILREFRPDVVLFHHLVRLSLVLPLLAQRAGVPSAYVLHDYYWICPSYSLFAWDTDVCPGGGPLRCSRCLFASRYGVACPPGLDWAGAAAIWLRNQVVRRATRCIQCFIAPSASVLRETALRGLALAPSTIIHNGSEPGPGQETQSVGDSVRFGYLGGISRKKGIATLVEAFRGALGRQLTIRGFPDEQSLVAFREAHPEFEGRLERFSASREDFFRSVDVVVVPSVWLENQPMVVIEAFAHGKPVLASRIGGLREMFREGEGGRFFESGDAESLREAARQLADNSKAVGELAAGIPAWPSWQGVTAQTVARLEGLVTGRQAAPA